MGNFFYRESASLVSGTSSADSIKNVGSYVTIDAGEGNDTIENNIEQANGLRNDKNFIRPTKVTFQGYYSSINGGAGNDVINDVIGYSTINPGLGNDEVTLGVYSVYEYAEGDGNDIVEHYVSEDVIHITGGTLRSTVESGNDVVLVVGSGKITLKGAKGMPINIVEGDDAVPVPSVGEYEKSVEGDEKNNTFYVQNPDVTVNGGNGNDVIINNSNIGRGALLIGDAGNDSLVSNSNGVILDGGEDNDKIELSGSGQIVRYRADDGNDTIIGYQSTDTIHIVDGSEYTTTQSGNDVIIAVGDGSITVKNVKDQTLNINTTPLPGEIYIPEWEIAEPTTRMIDYNKKKGIVTAKKKFYGVIDAQNFNYNSTPKIDASKATLEVVLKAGKASTELKAGQAESTLVGGTGKDKLYGGPSSDTFVYALGGGQDIVGDTKTPAALYHYEDNIVIVGNGIEDISDITVTDKKSAVIVTFDSDKKSKLTINKNNPETPVTFYFGPDSDTALSNGGMLYGELPDGARYAKKDVYTQIIVDDSIENTGIDMNLINSQLVSIDASNATGKVDLYGNAKNNVLKGSKGGSYLDGGAGNDSLYGSTVDSAADIFSYQMQNATNKDVIYNYNEGDAIIIDTSLLTSGIPTFDDETGVISYDGAKKDFNGFDDKKSDVVITLNKKNTLTIKDAAGKKINLYDEEGELLGTFGHILPDGLMYNDKRTEISVEDANSADKNEFIEINLSNEGEYLNQFYSTVLNVDMSSLTAAVELVGNAKNNSLRAGKGNSTLSGGAGNDSMVASTVSGAKTDFYYTSGKDVIYNFDPTVDRIFIDADTTISENTLSKVAKNYFVEKGNDVILNIDSKNTLTIKDGVGKIIEVVDEKSRLDNGSSSIKYDFSLPDGLKYDSQKRTMIDVSNGSAVDRTDILNIDLTNETNENYSFSTTVKRVDLNMIRDGSINAVVIGNGFNNTITAPNVGNSTLYGGHSEGKKRASADSINGGEGTDVFVYAPGDGKDVFKNYKAGDKISLDSSYGAINSITFADNRNVVSVTLNNDKNSVFTVTKWDINAPLVFECGEVPTSINNMTDWKALTDEGFTYGAGGNVSVNNDGTTLVISGKANEYVYADAREINSKIKLIDGRQAPKVLVEMIGNANANTIYAGNGGSIMDGGYDPFKNKATNDTIIGGVGDDEFVYNFSNGLAGKDVFLQYGYGDDWIVLDTAPKSVTTNGTEVQFNFDNKINGKNYTGTLKIRGNKPITSKTPVKIEINGEQSTYYFADNLKKTAWGDSDKITVYAGGTDTEEGGEEPEDPTVKANSADNWTKLSSTRYSYDYDGVQFTVSGSGVKDQTPGNDFESTYLSVIEADGIPDGILVDTENKKIILSEKLDQKRVSFTFPKGYSKKSYTWETYYLSEDSYELPASDTGEYWFTLNEALNAQTDSDCALEQIIIKEDAAVDMPSDILSDGVKQWVSELATNARHRKKQLEIKN